MKPANAATKAYLLRDRWGGFVVTDVYTLHHEPLCSAIKDLLELCDTVIGLAPKEEKTCPACGYTESDKEIHGDHHLCRLHKSEERTMTERGRTMSNEIEKVLSNPKLRRGLMADCLIAIEEGKGRELLRDDAEQAVDKAIARNGMRGRERQVPEEAEAVCRLIGLLEVLAKCLK